MKRNDIIFGIILIASIFLFIPLPMLAGIQKGFIYNPDYWAITSFIKFGLLSTLGEVLGLRIRSGKYYYKGFGIIPRAIVWGFLGIGIKMAFVVFSAGAPLLLVKLFGMENAIEAMKQTDIFSASSQGLGFDRLITAERPQSILPAAE